MTLGCNCGLGLDPPPVPPPLTPADVNAQIQTVLINAKLAWTQQDADQQAWEDANQREHQWLADQSALAALDEAQSATGTLKVGTLIVVGIGLMLLEKK